MPEKLSKKKLKSLLDKAVSQSESFLDSTLAKERREVEDYYLGKLPKPLHKGDSKYVSRDVFDVVDSARSTILEAFMASTRIVKFQPEQNETVDDAKNATDYTRQVFFKKNDGEQIMYDALSEGLKKRYAIAKVSYDETRESDDYEFEGLTMEELTEAVNEHDDYEFVEADVSDTGLVSGTYRVFRPEKGVVVEVIQPEDIYISSGSCSIDAAEYIIHRVSRTRSELLEMGYEESKVNDLTFGEDEDVWDIEKHQRWEDLNVNFGMDEAIDESSEKVTVYEIFIKVDRDGEGTNRLWKFDFCQGEILYEEQVSRFPFASFVPLPRAHTYAGENFAEGVIPIQNARTVLIRQIINHSLMTNNPRHQVVNNTVMNPAELLDNRMGGIVNVRRPDGIVPIPQAPLNPYVFNLIGMIDEDKEEVSGISRLSQGLNKDAISTQNSEGMVDQLINASQQRTKTVTRRFAKFIKELYLLIYTTAVDHIDDDVLTTLTGEQVQVNPSMWAMRSAASVELTLGHGDQEKEAQKWVELDQYFTSDQTLSHGYDYKKRYEVVRRALEKRGIEDIETFLTPPEEIKPPEPSPAEQVQMEQAKAQLENQRAQTQQLAMKAQTDMMKAQADLRRAMTDTSDKEFRQMLDAQRLDLERFVATSEIEAAEKAENQSATYNPDV